MAFVSLVFRARISMASSVSAISRIDFPPLRFALYLIHHGKRSIFSGADYQAFAFPGYFLFNRHGSMPELYAEFFRRFFLPLENVSAVDQHVVAIFSTVDHDRAEM